MSMPRAPQTVSLAEFEALEKKENVIYELIDGVVMMSPRPTILHQTISGNLYFALRNCLKDSRCTPIYEVELALDENDFVPDLMIVCEELPAGKRYERPPLIVVEIISPTSASRDHVLKRRKYEQLGVGEYWIVSPEEKCVTVLDFAAGREELYCEGEVKSFVRPELRIALDAIF